MFKLLFAYKKNSDLLPLLLIGLFIGSITSLDFIIVEWLSLGHFQLFPYSIGMLTMLAFVLVFFAYVYHSTILEYSPYIVLAGIIIGDQTKGIARGPDVADVVIFSSILLWVIIKLLRHESRYFDFELSRYGFLIVALIITIFVSLINGGFGSLVYFLVKGLRNFLASFVIITVINDKKKIIFFIKAFLVIISISAIIGIFQEAIFLWTGKIFPTSKMAAPMGLLVEETPIGTMLRISALSGFQQDFGNTLAIALALSFYLLISSNRAIFKRKLSILLCTLVTGIALMLTFSKGAWLAFFIAAYAGIYLRKPSLTIHLALLSLAIVVLAYCTGLLSEFGQIVNSQLHYGDLSHRLEMVGTTIPKAISEHFYIGTGLGKSTIYVSSIYGWPPHNTFVEVFAEIGIIGFIVYCMIFVYLFVRMALSIVTSKEEENRNIIILLFLGFLALIIYLQVSPFFMQLFPWIYIGLIEGSIRVFSGERNLSVAR